MKIIVAMLFTLTSCVVFAATSVLDPGDGRQYLQNWCGAQTVSEDAQGFNDTGNTLAAVKVTTRCATGGRGTRPRPFLSCWLVTFDDNGAILNQEYVNSGSWLLGSPPLNCALVLDPAATFPRADGAALSTSLVGTVFRA